MTSSTPKVSVCIPTYNGEKFIAQTIESILNQSFDDFELIISDDGSTDKTLEIVRSFRDPRISRIDSLAKVGSEANWNNSVVNARGELIKLICQDDLLYRQCLEQEVSTMASPQNKDVSFCFGLRDFVTPNGRIIKGRRVSGKGDARFNKSQFLKKVVRSGGNPIGEPMAVTFRRSAFEQAGKFHGDYVIDLAMWVSLIEFGPAIFVDQRLSAFRISKTSWTASLKDSQTNSVRALAKIIFDQNPTLISRADLVRGRLMGSVRAFVRQTASRLILFVDNFFRSAG